MRYRGQSFVTRIRVIFSVVKKEIILANKVHIGEKGRGEIEVTFKLTLLCIRKI